MLFKKAEPTFEKRLEKYWDNHEAVEAYRLVKYEIVNGEVKDGCYWLGSGDKEWARRQAKHYGLSITTPIDEDD